MVRTRVIWRKMIDRCINVNHIKYHLYGGKGVKVCPQWSNNFDQFVADMGIPPSKQHTLDRIDSDGDYEPRNCRWATIEQQNNNKANNVYLIFNGDKKSISQWARAVLVNPSTISERLKRGWSIERTLMTPIKSKNPIYTLKGKSQNLTGWAQELECNRDLLYLRLRRGWSVEETLTTPLRTKTVTKSKRKKRK